MTAIKAPRKDDAPVQTSRAGASLDVLARPAGPVLLAGLLSAAASAFMLRNGISLSPDGWDYWEASVSMLHGGGYRYFGGAPQRAFPPLFSSYLAAVQGIFGTTGASLIAAISLIGGATGACWMGVYTRIARQTQSSPWVSTSVAIFLAAFIGLHYRHLLSETLFLLLLGVVLLMLLQLRDEPAGGSKPTPALAGLILSASAMLVTRNSGLVFLPAIACVVFWRLRKTKPTSRLIRALASAGIPLVIWLATRAALSQGLARKLNFRAKWTPLEYLVQIPDGLARIMGPSGRQDEPLWNVLRGLAPPDRGPGWIAFIGLLGLVIWLARSGGDAAGKESRYDAVHVLTVGFSGLAGLYAIFNFTFVGDPLMSRFLWFIPLVLIVTAGGLLGTRQGHAPRRIGIAFLVLAAALQVYRYATVWGYHEPNVLPSHATAPAYKGKPPTPKDGLTYVSPPRYRGHEGRVPPFKPKKL